MTFAVDDWTPPLMDHDLKSLQVFMEREFVANRELAERMHVENQAKLTSLETKADKTNGRVTKLEVAVAVMRFAVYTIGGTLVLTGIQIAVGKLVP